MGALIKSATSAFQHDDHVTLNAQSYEHNFIDRMYSMQGHELGACSFGWWLMAGTDLF
jgi:hypothetical protein